MEKTLVIGDIHGKWISYSNTIKAYGATKSIQLGDFGIGFPDEDTRFTAARDDTWASGDHKFIRGNHDNPAECKKLRNFITDGSYDSATETMFIGGAVSIDGPLYMPFVRTEGVDWWPDEELSYGDFGRIMDIYRFVKPKIMITHDAPEQVILGMAHWYKKEIPSLTRQAFQIMFEEHQPEQWIYGHWHHSDKRIVNGTEFTCLDELETMWI